MELSQSFLVNRAYLCACGQNWNIQKEECVTNIFKILCIALQHIM